ncbi:uncharacterized protein LOC129321992 isoform X2 [Prosopis cineraria]|uniref:uncharacterized protein LOC129321992 isoform X2 n=1 Tax=Prosopis cineraria TaxID=364024 RepID=UPI00240FD838|nr:uncharacterized protein LOC129321992 isoform X2 [Prosopis cineraria]
MGETRGKRAITVLSSSSSEEIDDHDMEDTTSDDDYADDDDERQSVDDDDEKSDDSDDKSFSDKVFAFLQDCKAYLRKNGLRLAGNRDVCIERMREHWRIKDGHGYTLYPRSSFIIDCTGDVCKGDVVLFRQNVCEKFDKATQRGRHLGKRTVAGRVVKESYGATKQQHTFTVEVIWSSGVKKLPPLFPLLVKGRNLYKLKTYRQRWINEAERVKVLSEKHLRGAEARLVKAMRQKKVKCSAHGCVNGHFEIQHTKPSKVRRSCTNHMRKARHLDLDGHRSTISDSQPHETISPRQATWKQNASSRTLSTRGWYKSADRYQLPADSSFVRRKET